MILQIDLILKTKTFLSKLETFAKLKQKEFHHRQKNFISSIIKESKYCNAVIKKHFNKQLEMTEKDMKDLRTLLNVGFMIMIILMVMLK